MARKILKQFDFRKTTYKTTRKLRGTEFNELELSILERMGVISEDDTPVVAKKEKVSKKNTEDEG